MKHPIRFFVIVLFILFCIFVFVRAIFWYIKYKEAQKEIDRQGKAISEVLSIREYERAKGYGDDPFGDDNLVRVLFVGFDNRAGQEYGHCDGIQMIEIDREKEIVIITAVPRGTYAPLPPGTGTTSTDYYVSNSCAIGGLEYGIINIERILGKKADYIVVVGFSQTFGILRTLNLPTTETIQWLRNRQGYAIGEPQRARNHSTFIKQFIIKYVPSDSFRFEKTLKYILYRMVKTDLSFAQAEEVVSALSKMRLSEYPEKIYLAMKPAYDVQDIPYDPDIIDEHIANTIGKISGWLSKKDYSGMTDEEIQSLLIKTIDEKKDEYKFVVWAFENKLWFQVEDDILRPKIRWDIMTRYLSDVSIEERKDIIADYILEMVHLGKSEWEEKARALLLEEIY